MALPIGGIVKIIINWILVGTPSINILGAPIGTIVCYVLITVLNVVFMSAKLPEKPNIASITIRPVICTAIMGAGAYGVYGLMRKFIYTALGGGRIALIICLGAAILIAVIIYAVLIIALRAVTKDDVLLLPKGEKIASMLKIK
jgi:stage V sporulation protein B